MSASFTIHIWKKKLKSRSVNKNLDDDPKL